MTYAVMADDAIAKEATAGADLAVVMERDDGGDSLSANRSRAPRGL